MIKARYKCGYCDHIFALAYFNSQDIPERNIGCPNCRVAGEKTILIKKIRDERGVVDEHLFKKKEEPTIPKTYTLRQLRKLWVESGQVGKIYADLFLRFLEKREKEEEGTKLPGLRIEPGRPFVFGEKRLKKKTSRLDYPINVLESERDDVHCPLKSQVDQLQEAIDILTREKYKRVKEEFRIEAERIAKAELKKKKG